MLNFKNWFEQLGNQDENVDEREIDAVYDKASIAVKLVQLYDLSLPIDQRLLRNISTIANLASGAYGLYNSAENRNIIPPDLQSKIRLKFGSRELESRLSMIPRHVLKNYLTQYGIQVAPNQIKPGDVIRVNVKRIIQQLGDGEEAILQIASTIVHEATHELEREKTGTTSEAGPMAAERKFLNWVKQNKQLISQKLPGLKWQSSFLS